MTIKGTENFDRYPTSGPALRGHYKGVKSYGSVKYHGQSVIKVSPANVSQLESIGFRHVGSGTAYAYVVKP